mgnify:CR=1 FL=1
MPCSSVRSQAFHFHDDVRHGIAVQIRYADREVRPLAGEHGIIGVAGAGVGIWNRSGPAAGVDSGEVGVHPDAAAWIVVIRHGERPRRRRRIAESRAIGGRRLIGGVNGFWIERLAGGAVAIADPFLAAAVLAYDAAHWRRRWEAGEGDCAGLERAKV